MQTENAVAAPLATICVVFESRPDGGVRVYSDDVPGFVLSHPNRALVVKDIPIALETIISEMMKRPVKVIASPGSRSVPWFEPGERETREYKAVLAA